MRRLPWSSFSEADRVAYSCLTAFLNGRLEERDTIEWALRLKDYETVKRFAVYELIDSPMGLQLREPWRTAWRLIEESWAHPGDRHEISDDIYRAKSRLENGEKTGSLITDITNLVSPRLRVEAFSTLEGVMHLA